VRAQREGHFMLEILSIVLPIFIVFACGFFLKKRFKTDIASLSNVAFYCLLPALVFKTFYTSHISREIGWIILFAVSLMVALLLFTLLVSRCFRFDKSTEIGLLLASLFGNGGNYGSSIILLAYGQEGFDWAIAYFVIQSMMTNSFGVFLAAQDSSGIWVTLKKVLRMPILYAGLLGFLCQTLHIELHPIIYTPIELLSQAMIPLLMLILGMQLAMIKNFGFMKGVTLGVCIRLLISPLLAYFILMLFPFNDLAYKVLLLQAAMPTAVVVTLITLQYNRTPEMVAGVALFSTLFSSVTVSALLFLLQ